MEELKFYYINEIEDLEEKINFFDCGSILINKYLTGTALHDFYSNKSSTKVLVFNGEIVGFYTVKIDSFIYEEDSFNMIYLEYIAVEKRFQNNGIGGYMLRNCLDKSRESIEFLGLLGIALKSIPDRKEWYEKKGFVFLAEIDNDLSLMWLDTRTKDFFEYKKTLIIKREVF